MKIFDIFAIIKTGKTTKISSGEELKVRAMMKAVADKPELRDDIVRFVKDNGGLEYAVRQLDKYVAEAVEALSVLPLSKERELLEELAYFTAKRVM